MGNVNLTPLVIGGIATSSQVNLNFNSLYNTLNSLTSTNFSQGAGINASQISLSSTLLNGYTYPFTLAGNMNITGGLATYYANFVPGSMDIAIEQFVYFNAGTLQGSMDYGINFPNSLTIRSQTSSPSPVRTLSGSIQSSYASLPAAFNQDGSAAPGSTHIVTGSFTSVGGGTVTVNLAGASAFTGASTYLVFLTPTITQPSGASGDYVTQVSGSQFQYTMPGSFTSGLFYYFLIGY
jgi:hypothetical protein